MVDVIKKSDQFPNGPAKNMKSETVLDQTVAYDMLDSTIIREKYFEEYIRKRIKRNDHDRVHFFKPVKNLKLNTGLNKEKKKSLK